jgi:septum formation inhibitor-activating ATPase MinD
MGVSIGDVQEVLDNKIISILPYSREAMKSINKGKPALVSAANSDLGKKLAKDMRSYLGGDMTPVLGTGTNSNGDGRKSGGLWRLMRRNRTPKVPELERA